MALQFQRLRGFMVAAIIVIPHARCHMCPLQLWFLWSFSLLSNQQSKQLLTPMRVRTSLTWWTQLPNLLRVIPFVPLPPIITVRLGYSSQWRLCRGAVACISHDEAHQFSRASSDTMSASKISLVSQRENCASPLQQYDGSLLLE